MLLTLDKNRLVIYHSIRESQFAYKICVVKILEQSGYGEYKDPRNFNLAPFQYLVCTTDYIFVEHVCLPGYKLPKPRKPRVLGV